MYIYISTNDLYDIYPIYNNWNSNKFVKKIYYRFFCDKGNRLLRVSESVYIENYVQMLYEILDLKTEKIINTKCFITAKIIDKSVLLGV